MDILSSILPIGTLLLGAFLTFLADTFRHNRARRELIEDTLKAKRTEAYVAFLEAAHTAAHLLGRSAPGCPNPISPNPERYWLIDSDVTHKMRTIELIGSDLVVDASREVRVALNQFRGAVASQTIAYDSPEYWDAYSPVRASRNALVLAGRQELVS